MDIDNPELEQFRQDWREEVGLLDHGNLFRHREVSEASSSTMRPTGFTASTASSTIRGVSEASWPHTFGSSLSPDYQMDMEPSEAETFSNVASDEGHFIIATDFGTTFSSVAFTRRHPDKPSKIEIIVNYADDPMTNGKKSTEVPTESWYPITVTLSENDDETSVMPTNGEAFEDVFDDDDFDQPLPGIRNGNVYDEREDESDDQEMVDVEPEETMEGGRKLPAFFWGYGTQAKLLSPDVDQNQFGRIARSKLMLDSSNKTQTVRDELRPILNQLKRRGIIGKDDDVIADYLTQLFLHTKEQLTLYHGLTEFCAVEHVLCVPNIWSSKGCRMMQNAMETAIRISRLGSLNNLFIVAEPEAAAAFVLEDNDIVKPGETFVIIDAGGGTVDATTYTVNKNYPLRLKREVVEPTGGLFGSSYLNEEFRKHLLRRLENEDYLAVGGSTVEGLVDAAVVEFENKVKRTVDVTKEITGVLFTIPGLRANPRRRFREHKIIIQHNDFVRIFKPLLRGIAGLMHQQIRLAMGAGLQVHKVILIGGFAGSPSLIKFLSRKLRFISSELENTIELFVPQESSETAVSRGAVLRALDKNDGPIRKTLSSYGFLRTEPHEPTVFKAHEEVRPTLDKLDGKLYVRNTIDWLIKKGDEIPPHQEYPVPVEHTFSVGKKLLLCEEILYVSDTSTESHYRATHPKNSGAEKAGRIVADMTFLKTEGIIQPINPEPGERGKRHYKVEFELVMIIDGRNLRYEARYPAGGQVQDRGQISIAAAFEPGTN